MGDSGDLKYIFTLLIVFQIKQFLADYPLQFPFMLRKTSGSWDFLLPLTLHCLVHAVLTLAICLWFAPSLAWLAVFDFAVHFLMDRFKSGPRYLGRFNDTHRQAFWIALGFDQLVHHLTHLYIIWVILTQNA